MVCRSNSKDIAELHDYALSIVERVNCKYSSGSYQPVVWIERPVSLYEKIALYSVADVAVVTATRDGMNLVPYEYIVCRQGAPVSLSMLMPPCAAFCFCRLAFKVYVLWYMHALYSYLCSLFLLQTSIKHAQCTHSSTRMQQ